MAGRIQLHMWDPFRDHLLRRHAFYVEQAKGRVLSQFKDINGEAEKFADDEYDRIGLQPAYYEMDDCAAAEMANDRAQDFYGLLTDLHREMTLATLAGLYHQWDKDLRGFIDSELGKDGVASDDIKKVVWKRDIAEVVKLLAEFGWDCRTDDFFADLDAARLVVNVYKHGKGKSLDDLVAQHPEFLREGLAGFSLGSSRDYVDHEWLSVSDEQFDRIATAIEAFWRAFPERLVYPTTT